jgi:endonuclease YncB( thermonuclease family)
MGIIRRRSVSRAGAFHDTPQTASLDRYATLILLTLKRAPLLLIVGTVAAILVAVSVYLFFNAGSASPAAGINGRSKPAKAAPAAEAVNANIGPDVTVKWSGLEPAYKSYKIQVDNDNRLQTDQQAVELYGISILPRSQICSYQGGERWACGQRAYIALLNILGAAPVDCRPQQTDQPRIVVCRLGGSDIAELMLREGWGTLAKGVSEQRYIDAATASFTNKAGMWSLQPSKR